MNAVYEDVILPFLWTFLFFFNAWSITTDECLEHVGIWRVTVVQYGECWLAPEVSQTLAYSGLNVVVLDLMLQHSDFRRHG